MALPPQRRAPADAASRCSLLAGVIALIEVGAEPRRRRDPRRSFAPEPGLRGRRVLGEPPARRRAALRGAAGHHVPEPRVPARLAPAHGDEHDDPARARPLHRRPLRAGAILPVFLLGAIGGGAVFGLLSPAPIRWWGRRGRSSPSSGSGSPGTGGGTARPGLRPARCCGGWGCWVLNVVALIGLQGMLAWQAHLGGFLVGLACGAWLERRTAKADRAARRRRGAAAAATRRASSGSEDVDEVEDDDDRDRDADQPGEDALHGEVLSGACRSGTPGRRRGSLRGGRPGVGATRRRV